MRQMGSQNEMVGTDSPVSSKPLLANRFIHSSTNELPYSSRNHACPPNSSYSPADSSLPFYDEQIDHDLITENGVSLHPKITCKVEKGFFPCQENNWTCYRRNYFSVSCSYSLDPQINYGAIYIKIKNNENAEAK